MPSWNIHIAHVEAALRSVGDPSALGIGDQNAFLFGNFVPDINVGYMVKNPDRRIEYRVTHFADPGFMPEPHYWEFWERYALPSADANGRVSDATLGAWCHLVADNRYNHAVNALLLRRGLKPGEDTRIRKQGDFDLFGRTLRIGMTCEPTPALVRQAAEFPQYAIDVRDARAAVEVANQIVRNNWVNHFDGDPVYRLLSSDFFRTVFDEVQNAIGEGLLAYARQGAVAPELRRERAHA